MNLNDLRDPKPTTANPNDREVLREVLQAVLKVMAFVLPVVAYWTWHASSDVGSQAGSAALSTVAALVTAGVWSLVVLQRRGLAGSRGITVVLCAALLVWALTVAAWGGRIKLELLLPLICTVTAALGAGLRQALFRIQQDLEREPGRGVNSQENVDGQLESLFSKAFELSPLSMSLTRARDGVFLALNAASEHVHGYKPEELLGRSALDLGNWESVSEREQFLQQVRDHEGRFESERRLRRKDGSRVDCRFWATLVEVGGETCLLCAALDLTSQKQRETMLLDLAEGLGSPLGEPLLGSAARYLAKALNADLVMVAEISAEARMSTLALWKDEAQLPNSSLECHKASLSAVLDSADLVLLEAEGGLPLPESPAFCSGTDDIFRSCAGLALRDADGTAIGVLCALWRDGHVPTNEESSVFRIVANRSSAELIRLRRDREIVRLKDSLEYRVLARTEQLRATNAELESFGYSVSHDLQSPLRSIQGFMFLLERRLKPRLSAEETRLIERITANVLRMHELINDLLGLARVSRGALNREPVNLSVIAEHLFADLQMAAPQRLARVLIAPGLEAFCDAKLARIVLENLLGNAWKYTRKAGVAHIELGAVPTKASAPTTFFLRDNGAGFNMDYADSLFKPFHRLHHEDEYEGSGIGLATVHRILERHGGSIRAEAVEGQGACFYFTFEDALIASVA